MNSCLPLILDGFLSSADIENTDDIIIDEVCMWVVWTFRKFFFLQFDNKFASNQQRLAKIGIILWFLLSTQILQVWHTTWWDENAECDMHGLEGQLRTLATQCLQCVWPDTAVHAILTITSIEDKW